MQRQVAKVASGLFYCWSLLPNNNMATIFIGSLHVTAAGVLLHVTVECKHLGRCYGKKYLFIWLVGQDTFPHLATSEMPTWVHPWM